MEKKIKKIKKSGFTLIELLVAIGIMAILITMTFAYLSGGRKNLELETEARKVSAVIRSVQNASLTGKFDDGESPTTCNNQYVFNYSNLDQKYSISGCVNGEYNLEGNVEFLSSGNFIFHSPHGKLDPESIQSVGLSKDSAIVYICIYPSGNIEEQKEACF